MQGNLNSKHSVYECLFKWLPERLVKSLGRWSWDLGVMAV